jgi:hypothetical protein
LIVTNEIGFTLNEESLVQKDGKFYIGFQMANARYWVAIDCNGDVGSLIGLPRQFFHSSLYLDAKSIVFDYLPTIHGGGLYLGTENFFLTSLAGIGKTKAEVDYILLGKNIASNVLGLLQLNYNSPDLNIIKPYNDEPGYEKVEQVCAILMKHVTGDKDIMDCHEELTRAGLKNYAKL